MKKVAVIGAGTMGNGIAHVFAMNGYDVKLVDISEDALGRAVETIGKNLDRMVVKGRLKVKDKKNTLANIVTSTDIATIKDRELVVEAATENVDLKLRIFKELDVNTKKTCILATNTSSISITKIASVTSFNLNAPLVPFLAQK